MADRDEDYEACRARPTRQPLPDAADDAGGRGAAVAASRCRHGDQASAMTTRLASPACGGIIEAPSDDAAVAAQIAARMRRHLCVMSCRRFRGPRARFAYRLLRLAWHRFREIAAI